MPLVLVERFNATKHDENKWKNTHNSAVHIKASLQKTLITLLPTLKVGLILDIKNLKGKFESEKTMFGL